MLGVECIDNFAVANEKQVIGLTISMRVSSFFMPFFALFAGASGYYLRSMELRTVFDAHTGLPQRGAVVTYALIGLSAVFLCIILIFTLCARAKFASPSGFVNAFGTEPLAYPSIFFLIGIVWLGATVLYFLNIYTQGSIQLSELCFSILSALSAISVSLFAIEVYQNPRRKSKYALSIVPTIFMCFWLILLYRQNASNPILLSYCYQCLAIISSALGFYFTSGFIYNRPAPGKTIFSFFAAIYFCLVALADEHTMSIKFIFIAIIVINVIYSSMLIRNMVRKDY